MIIHSVREYNLYEHVFFLQRSLILLKYCVNCVIFSRNQKLLNLIFGIEKKKREREKEKDRQTDSGIKSENGKEMEIDVYEENRRE